MANVLDEEGRRIPNEPAEPAPLHARSNGVANPPKPTTRARPHSVAAERSALGAMLIRPAAVDDCLTVLRPDDFYVPLHRETFAAITALAARQVPVDPLTVSEEMRSAGTLPPEGPAFLVTLQAGVPSSDNAASYAAIVADKARLRRLQDVLAEALDALDQDKPERAWAVARSVDDVTRDPKLRTWTTGQLVDADRTFRWMVHNLLVNGTYGMLAGERKSLKTYVAMAIAVSVASGHSLFDTFPVAQPAPVVFYVGEGGRVPFTRRLERVADSMHVPLRDLPLYPSFDVAPIESDTFQTSLRAHLKDHQPGLVHLDPLYAFHGSKANGTNLHEEGALLSSVSAPCIDAGAALLITNHFSKTGTGRGLDRITLTGPQEWSDTWLLLSHREPPHVEGGSFRLLLEVGSRQWGGAEWDLDIELGRFDSDTGDYDGAIRWTIDRHDTNSVDDEALERLLTNVYAQPGELTKEEIAKSAGINLRRARQLVEQLERDGLITPRLIESKRTDGRTYRAWRFFPTDQAPPPPPEQEQF